MPIMAASEWTDDRSTTLLMAENALECLTDKRKAAASTVVLNNVYRLLESYKGNPFFGYLAEDPREDHEMEGAGSEPELHDVRYAIESALKVAFKGQPEEKAISAVEAVLRGLVAPKKHPQPAAKERKRAQRFFSELSQRLAFT